MRGRKSAQTTTKLQSIRNAPKKHQKQQRRKATDDDGGWEDLAESTGTGVRLPAAIKTFRVEGLVALPSAVKAACVAACVFYAFGSALLFCVATLGIYGVLMVCSSASATTESADDMLECSTLAHLEHRLRRRTLSIDDCLHYVLVKIMRLVEAINTLRRSMLDYSFTVSIAESSASHDLIELVNAAEKDKHSSKQQLNSKATSTQHQKKKKQKKTRVKTIITGQITIEEYTYLPEARAVQQVKKEEELVTVVPPAPVVEILTLKKVKADVAAAELVHDLKQETAVVLEQLQVEELLPILPTPNVRVPTQPKAAPAKPATHVRKQSTVQIAAKPLEKKNISNNSKPALRIETVEKPKDDVQIVMQLPKAEKTLQPVVVESPVVEMKVVREEPKQQVEDVCISTVPALIVDTTEIAPPVDDSADKSKRRRSSRSRRSRTRRSTLSITERPSSFYDEFLLLEPMIVKPTTPKISDKNQNLYTTEAQKVRNLQQTQLPFETKSISTPEIRIMVDEVNNMVAGMHTLLAKNWEFLATLSEEIVAEKKEKKVKPAQLSSVCQELSTKCVVDKDVRTASNDDELLQCEEEPEFEDERFGDLEYDDHYYAYHAMSTPCL